MKSLLFALVFLVGCQQSPAQVSQNENSHLKKYQLPLAWRDSSFSSHSARWEKLVFNQLAYYRDVFEKQEIKNAELMCTSLASQNTEIKKWHWALLISLIIKYESGFNTNTFYVENFQNSDGENVVSRGLFQLSRESVKGYGCRLTDEELHNDELNIQCGIRIMAHWLKRDGVIQGHFKNDAGVKKHLGLGRYWSVMREERSSNIKIWEEMKIRGQCTDAP